MSRNAQRRRAEFFAAHPFCCFCGGKEPATETDHVPSRSLFHNRQWPEGFEFPACARCNDATQADELVVAVLARSYPDPSTPEEGRKLCDLFRTLAERRQDVLQAMKMSAIDVRRELRRRRIEIPPGYTTQDFPFIATSSPLVESAVRNFGRKLNLALFYYHTGRIVPPEGGVAIRWFSNLQVHEGHLPEGLASALPGMPTLQRNQRDLSDQFYYRHGIPADTREVAGFLSLFRQSFAIMGWVQTDASRFPEVALKDVLRPYVHRGPAERRAV